MAHGVSTKTQRGNGVTFLLAGNPNTGKSVILNRVTGIGVIVSNYPGTTVGLIEGKTRLNGKDIRVIDLPGTYSIGVFAEDQRVARRAILEAKSAVIIDVIDASNLSRNLYLTLQLLELEVPMVVALNMVDFAAMRGFEIDEKKLSEILGVPVVPTVATRGEGLKELMETALEVAEGRWKESPMKLEYDADLEAIINRLEKAIKKDVRGLSGKIPPRALALRLLEGDPEFVDLVQSESGRITKLANSSAREIEDRGGVSVRVGRRRHEVARNIAWAVTSRSGGRILLRDKLSDLTVDAYTGFPIMLAVGALLFGLLIFGGGFLEELITAAWGGFGAPAVDIGLGYLISQQALRQILRRGLVLGLEAGLAVVIPYITLFYIALAMLEDTGYLARMAYLMDNAMHRLGLHGRAVIPLIAGFGCNVPAIMGTRILETRRERILTSFLITLAPCSARTVVILGVVGVFVGVIPALTIYLVALTLMGIMGFALNRLVKGETTGLVMEMPPYRLPHPVPVLKKTWIRFKHFIRNAFPLLLAGSLALSIMEHIGWLQPLAESISPVVNGWLGLPVLSGIALFFGILRKEMTLEMLVVTFGTSNFAAIMTPLQMFVFALVVTIYFPCVATFAALGRELGWRDATLIAVSTILLALAVGGFTNQFLSFFGLLG